VSNRKVFALFGEITIKGVESVNKKLSMVDKEAKKVSKELDKLGKNLTNIGYGFAKKITAPVVAATAGITALAVQTGKYADRLLDLNQITGLSTNTLQELENVSREAGVSFEGLTGTISKFTNQIPEIAKGSGTAHEAIKKLGVNVFDTSGNVRDMNILFPEMLSKLRDVQNVTERNAIAQDIFGRSLDDIAPVLGMTNDQFNRARVEAHELGLVLGNDALNNANNFRIGYEKVGAQITALSRSIAVEFVPIINNYLMPAIQKHAIPAIKSMAGFVKNTIIWFENLSPSVRKFVTVLGVTAAAIGPVLIVGGQLIGFLSGAYLAFKNVILIMGAIKWAALLTNPVGLAIAALASLTFAIWQAVDAYNNLKIAKENNRKTEEINAINQQMVELIKMKNTYKELAQEQERLKLAGDRAFSAEKLAFYNEQIEKTLNKVRELNAQVNPKAAARLAAGGALSNSQKPVADSPAAIIPAVATGAPDLNIGDTGMDYGPAVPDYQTGNDALIKNIQEYNDVLAESYKKRQEKERQWSDAVMFQSADRIRVLEMEQMQILADTDLSESAKANVKMYYDNLIADEYVKNEERKKQAAGNAFNFAVSSIQSVFSIFEKANQNEIALLDQKTKSEIANIQSSKMSEESKIEAIDKIEKKADAEKRKLMREQAKRQKASAIFGVVVNTAMAIMTGFAQLGPIGGAIAAVLTGLMGTAQIATIAAEPLPMAIGGLVESGNGGVNAIVGEGREDELVLPMKTGVSMLAESLLDKIASAAAPGFSNNNDSFLPAAAVNTNNSNSRKNEVHLHIGTLVADELGLKKLAQTLEKYTISESQRKAVFA
jgi:hypothetical protein